jgi:putative exonuclease SbcCD C subunit
VPAAFAVWNRNGRRAAFAQLSGGEQSVSLNLSLSRRLTRCSIRHTHMASRLVALDEAFAGFDDRAAANS